MVRHRAARPLVALVLLLSSSAFAGKAATVDTATLAQKERAQREYTTAMKAFEAGRNEDALKGFQRSYDAVRSPNSHFMIARTLARMGLNVEAYEALSLVIEETEKYEGRYDETATAAYAKREDIRPRIALLTVEVDGLPKKSKLMLEGKPLPSAAGKRPVAVLPGIVRVQATLPDGRAFEKKTEIVAGEEGKVTFGPGDFAGDEEPIGDTVEPFRPKYELEVEVHGSYTSVEPPGPANHGGGPGVRVTYELLRGLFWRNDGVGVGAGVDWAVTSAEDHVWIPVVAQYNAWVLPELSLFAEPGVAVFAGAGEDAYPVFQAGVRYAVSGDWLNVTARVGIPLVSVGFSAMW